MKKFIFLFIICWVIIPAKSQTKYIRVDTILPGSTVKVCFDQYPDGVCLIKRSGDHSFEWQIEKPIFQAISNIDSIIVNYTNNGSIVYFSGSFVMLFYFYHITQVYSPNLPDTILTCGNLFSFTLNAQNQNNGVNYLWFPGGETTQSINANKETVYIVFLDNGCSSISDTTVIISDHTNDAHLGPDQTICLNTTINLNPGNNNIVSYTWNTGSTNPTITVSTAGIYSVTTVDQNNCVSTDTINVDVILPYQHQQICMVSFDTISYKNKIFWDQHLGVGIDSIEIQKEIALNVWERIGVVPNSVSSFLDITSNPQTNSDSYRILVIDSCGNRSNPSNIHTTITLLTSYTPGINVMGFNWSHYKVNNLLIAPHYTIYGIDANNVVHVIGSVPGSQNYYNWYNPDLTYIKFYVGFTLTCGTKTNYLVRSNYTSNPTMSIEDNSLNELITIYPTLTSGEINIISNLTINEIKVYSLLGQELLTTKKTIFTIPQKGLCFVSINTNKGTITKKVVVY